jgi:hypothetical protein
MKSGLSGFGSREDVSSWTAKRKSYDQSAHYCLTDCVEKVENAAKAKFSQRLAGADFF